MIAAFDCRFWNPERPIYMQGTLSKLGRATAPLVKMWQNRHVVLTDASLMYWQTREDFLAGRLAYTCRWFVELAIGRLDLFLLRFHEKSRTSRNSENRFGDDNDYHHDVLTMMTCTQA